MELESNQRWKEWLASRWGELIEIYARLRWAMIPIGVRQKRPLRSEWNYNSKGAAGPYLKVDEAKFWTSRNFNLAIVAGPSRIIWCDLDKPELFDKSFLEGLCMITPRGYAMPLKRDRQYSQRRINTLKSAGFDFRDDILYELVPLSVTCLKDHHLGTMKHPTSGNHCVNDEPHDFRVREWISSLDAPLHTYEDVWEAYKQ